MSDDENLPAFATRYVNLASAALGARAERASDEFFAAKERMLQDSEPVFYPGKYDDNGKWMDGWETRRRRHGGHDHCVVRLAHAGVIHGVEVDTRFFTGNYPPGFSLEGTLGGDGEPDDDGWQPIVEKCAIAGDCKNYIPVENAGVFDAVRVHIYPDGGVARLRIYGQAVWNIADADAGGEYELSAIANGGRVIACSDSHYGAPWRIFAPGRGQNMGDGWETRRRRDGGSDWLVAALGRTGRITRIEVDTAHFKGNYPDRCSIQAALAADKSDEAAVAEAATWPFLLPEQKLEMDRQHLFSDAIDRNFGAVSHIRFNNIPDGGISRLRITARWATMVELVPQPLTADAFAPFGDVIETGAAAPLAINEGLAQRFDDLAKIDTGDSGGQPCVSVFVSNPRPLPITIDMIERHPLGSQLFMPLGDHPYLVAVVDGTPPFEPGDLTVFVISDGRGVNYRKGLWHLPLTPLYRPGRFLVVDRAGPGANCDEFRFPAQPRITVALEPPR